MGHSQTRANRWQGEGNINELTAGIKRLIDLVGALVGLLVTAVLTPFIALAIRLDSPGSILFAQERAGKDGRPFTVYKFRSMCRDAEAQLDGLVNIEMFVTEPRFKLENDPRVTRIGRFLRRWSLDELPQFYNVLLGEMSLIGPRPEETRVVAFYNAHQRRRLAMKPGLSGPMQIRGRGNLSMDERLRLELDYIENYSLGRDLVLLIKTIPAVLSGLGAR